MFTETLLEYEGLPNEDSWTMKLEKTVHDLQEAMVDFDYNFACVKTRELDESSSIVITRCKSDTYSYMNHEKHVTMCERVDDDTVVGEEGGLSSTLALPLETFSLEYCERTHAR